MLIKRFAVPVGGVWVERAGVTVMGTRPEWLDWPSMRADEMASESWRPNRKGGR